MFTSATISSVNTVNAIYHQCIFSRKEKRLAFPTLSKLGTTGLSAPFKVIDSCNARCETPRMKDSREHSCNDYLTGLKHMRICESYRRYFYAVAIELDRRLFKREHRSDESTRSTTTQLDRPCPLAEALVDRGECPG